MILLALVNSNYEFMFVDIGKNGRMCDGGVIEYTQSNKQLISNKLKLPERSENVRT